MRPAPRVSLINVYASYAGRDSPSLFNPRLLHTVSVHAKRIVRLSRDTRRYIYTIDTRVVAIVVASSRIVAAAAAAGNRDASSRVEARANIN